MTMIYLTRTVYRPNKFHRSSDNHFYDDRIAGSEIFMDCQLKFRAVICQVRQVPLLKFVTGTGVVRSHSALASRTAIRERCRAIRSTRYGSLPWSAYR
jgi:hypothetical protein